MAEKLINFRGGKIISKILSDIVMTSKKCFENIYIYGYEDKNQNITDVKNMLQQLQSFGYVIDFQEVCDGYYHGVDFREDIKKYSSKDRDVEKNPGQFKYRQAKFFIRVNIPKWNYLNFLIDRGFKNIPGDFIENKKDHKALSDCLKLIKKDISLFKDLVYLVTKEQRPFIEGLKKIKTTQRHIYAEHTLYFLYFCDTKNIEIFKEEILSHKDKLQKNSVESEKITSIRIDTNGLIWSGQKKVGDLTPKQLKLYKTFERGTIAMPGESVLIPMKISNDSFKKLKNALNKRMKAAGISELFRFEYNRKSKKYHFIINKREPARE